ncbi:hypothetical protein [Ekhidna sp.]|uniref:hypothetical protein n=1 Tax=Ekhidna sp. TaxID=2608089 RepID=UPI0032981613
MKKVIFTLLLSAFTFISSAQDLFTINNWSDSTVFRWAHPTIRGYSHLSDSLAQSIPGKAEFYHYNGTYYAINSWADYYNWFTKAYWYRFKRPVLEYETFYLLGDDFMMVEWLYSQYERLRRKGLLQKEDPFSNSLERFAALVDKSELKSIARERKARKNQPTMVSQSDQTFGSFTSSASSSAAGGGPASSGNSSGGTTNSGRSIGN